MTRGLVVSVDGEAPIESPITPAMTPREIAVAVAKASGGRVLVSYLDAHDPTKEDAVRARAAKQASIEYKRGLRKRRRALVTLRKKAHALDVGTSALTLSELEIGLLRQAVDALDEDYSDE